MADASFQLAGSIGGLLLLIGIIFLILWLVGALGSCGCAAPSGSNSGSGS